MKNKLIIKILHYIIQRLKRIEVAPEEIGGIPKKTPEIYLFPSKSFIQHKNVEKLLSYKDEYIGHEI